MSSTIATVIATTTQAIQNVFTNDLPGLWVFLIGVSALLAIVGLIMGIFGSSRFRRGRRGRR